MAVVKNAWITIKAVSIPQNKNIYACDLLSIDLLHDCRMFIYSLTEDTCGVCVGLAAFTLEGHGRSLL